MTTIPIGARSTLMVQSLVNMRAQLDELNRQLGTGQKSTTYAGLGINRGLSVALNTNLAAISGYNNTITNVTTRLQLASTTLGRLSEIGTESKTVAVQASFDPDSKGQTSATRAALSGLSEFLSLLNTHVGDHYFFSGSASDRPAVETTEHILDGDGARAGFKQIMEERRQADLGSDGLGRLVLSAPTTTSVSIAEDAAGSPFGFKLSHIATSIAGATVTQPGGSPASASIDLGTSNAVAGDTITLQVSLPDGSKEDIKLTATTDDPPGIGQFTIGATPDDTAANIQTALATAIKRTGDTALTAASAMAAADDFFNTDATHPPQRVNGPPFDTATSLVDGTTANTVSWYTGEAGSSSARGTATARIDTSITVSYGMRANEEGIRFILQNLAVQAASTYSGSDPAVDAERATALNARLNANYAGPPGMQSIQNIAAELAGAQSSLVAASDRHRQTAATLQDLQQQITGVSNEEVGSQILALQTRLTASLQTTSMLYQMSLVNFL
ncbi:MAG TPA: flagellar biosynthesis protein FlgL [Pseudolabrys sp.]|nr:flagellar biosynthesis protein FlgL [Pseudolabrys sp.]